MTLLDYPDKIAALIFTQGCNFSCGYCHNPEMISPFRILEDEPMLEVKQVLHFLSHRKGMLEGVVISGGEPTLHDDLEDFMIQIRNMGFLIKLDSNGARPEVLQRLFERHLVDYIAMDIKFPLLQYRLHFPRLNPALITQSIELILHSDMDYEFRSTILPFYHDREDIREMGQMICGAKRWYLQNFRPVKTLNPRLARERPFTMEELEEFRTIAENYVNEVGVRS